MAEQNDMDHPITRRELEETLDKRNYVTQDQLPKWAQALRDDLYTSLTRDLHASITRDLHASITRDLHASITEDIRGYIAGLTESHRSELGVIDDQYKDLPARVTKLEEAVFPPPRARRKRRAS